MAYDEGLAERLREVFRGRRGVSEKKMFGGIAFMVDGYMAVGIVDDTLMARVGPPLYEQALHMKHVRPMDFTGRPMKGYIFVGPGGTRTEKSVKRWVDLAVAFVATLDDSATSKRKKASGPRDQARSGKKTGRSSGTAS